MAIPFADFDQGPVYSRWGINITRHGRFGYQALGGRHHNPLSWTEFTLPAKIAKNILKPVLVKKLRTLRNRFALLKQKAKANVLFADISPHVNSLGTKLAQMQSRLRGDENGRTLQSLVDETDNALNDLARVELITHRAEGFERASRKSAGKVKVPQILPFTLSPMVKVRKDFPLPAKLNKDIRISAAKGESESAQIVLATWAKPIRTVRVKITDLVNPTDKTTKISRDNGSYMGTLSESGDTGCLPKSE